MSVVTRFAPSPTGFLHIGGARTALFNWLYARHMGGKYLLRIEDTDRQRSTPEAIEAVLAGLDWLGLGPDEAPVYQSLQRNRHVEVASQLLDNGHAYRCYCTPEELARMREKAKEEKRSIRYDGTWRDRDPADAPDDINPVIRLRAPQEGETIIQDAVQGSVTIANTELDDLIMLRADGSPTYMLSVVVDDHDMGVTHAIRGDDHLTNAFRQTQIFQAMGWRAPVYAHIPLIHGPDGAKLSKRHGALGVGAYKDMGYLPEAVLNYLCRLGWSHGDDEFFEMDKAVSWFDIADINKGASRLDFEKLANLNAKYIAASSTERLLTLITPGIEKKMKKPLDDDTRRRLSEGMDSLKPRAQLISQLADKSMFYCLRRPLEYSEKAARLLDEDGRSRLSVLETKFAALDNWTADALENLVKSHIEGSGGKLSEIAQPLRAALTGTTESPGIFEVATVLGKDETIGRIRDAIDQA
ncbi:MAG: Glutamate--tRNA ligase [Alphaproteobacteria bacterium MarineAlpha11_Bin1]|nr:MAG: Glutamate--tRNA ligase [Alphaproteobacteria bacterium MarineAlpha11_Bin1]